MIIIDYRMNKLKLCIFTECRYAGGLDTFLINLVNSWPVEEDEITLYCNSNHLGIENIKQSIHRNIGYCLYKKNPQFFLDKIFSERILISFYSIIEYIFLPLTVLRLAVIFKKSNYSDLLVVNGGYPASLVCRASIIAWKLAGKYNPPIMNFHSSAIISNNIFYLIDSIIDSIFLKVKVRFLTVSKYCAGTIKNRKNFNNINVEYIYNGINIDYNFFLEIKNRKINDHKFKCIMLATYDKYKGHEFLIDAFSYVVKEIPNIILNIYGNGRKEDFLRIKNYIDANCLNNYIKLNGFMNNTFEIYSQASLVLVPSQGFESFCLVVVEAMAYGLPFIATKVGGIPEVAGEEFINSIIDSEDPISFANKIIANIKNNNPKCHPDLKRARYEKMFTSVKMAQEYRKHILN